MIPASESVKLLTSSLKGMKLSANEAISVVDKLTKLDMKSATSAQELAQALSKVANSARLAKVSQDEILGILSVGIETTQQSGDVIGTAVRSLLARFSNVKASKFGGSGEETEGTLNDTEAVLSKIGIRIRNASGEMRSFMDVLDDVAEKWDTLDDVSRNAISTAMAGTRQKEIFASIIENYDRVKELIDESANAAGTADEKYSAYMDSMEAATKRLQNAWEGFTQSIETSTVMKFLTNATAMLVENMDKLKYLITYIAAAGSAKIFDLFTNKGETGGFKGLIANIPFIGRGTKTNNILESIDKKVGNIEKGVGADSIANQTKNGGLFKRLGGFLKTGFGFGDIYDPDSNTSINRKVLRLYKQSQKGKIRLQDDFLGYTKGLTDDEREFLRLSDAVGSESAKKQMEQYNKLLKKRQIGNATMGATSAVLTNLFTTKQVGASGLGKLANTTDQTVEETVSDKIGRTLASGALAAAGGYFFGPFGAMLGQALGENFAGMISTWAHADELSMKQRVADAKEQLNSLNSLSEKLDTNNDLVKSSMTVENREDFVTYAEEIRDFLYDNDKLRKVILDSTGSENLSDLVDKLTSSDGSVRIQAQNAIIEETKKQTYQSLLESQQEERSNLQSKFYYEESPRGLYESEDDVVQLLKSLGYSYKRSTFRWQEGSYFYSNKTLAEQAENLKKTIDQLKDAEDETSRKTLLLLEDYYDNVQNRISKQKSLDKELLESGILPVSYLNSGVESLKPSELSDLGIEGAIKQIAESIGEMGYSVFDESGKVYANFYDSIKKYLKDQDIYQYLEYGTQNLSEMIKTGNVERLQQFANAFHITTDEAKKMSEQFGYLTIQMGNMTPSEVTEYYENLTSIFEKLNSTSGLTGDVLSTIFSDSTYSDLVPYALQGAEALQKALNERLFGGSRDILMKNAIADSILGNSSIFDDFYKKMGTEIQDKLKSNGITSLIGLKDYIDALSDEDVDKSELQKEFEDYLKAMNVEYYDYEYFNRLSEAQTKIMSEQISNLEQQKEALGQINDEREKELNLIKARQKLEDAKKEKKLVYRAGVGFVAEGDAEAIKSAQEELDQLDTEKQQENIQLQIDSITRMKEILEGLPEEKTLEEAKNIIKEFAGKEGVGNSLITVTSSIVSTFEEAKKSIDIFNATLKPGGNGEGGNGIKGKGDGNLVYSGNKAIMASEDTKFSSIRGRNFKVKIGDKSFKVETGDYVYGEEIDEAYKKDYGNSPIAGRSVYYYNGRPLIKGALKGQWYVISKRMLSDNSEIQGLLDAMGIKSSYASGTLSHVGGNALINENGTEGIITPGGTLTALPSKTGIVPADITKNLWALGEVAPTLVARLGSLNQKTLSGNAGNTTYEEGQYFDNFTMNVYPAKGDDFSKILEQAKAQMKLTRHNN